VNGAEGDDRLGVDLADFMSKTADVEPGDPPALTLLTLSEFVQRPMVSSHVRGVLPARAIVVVFGPPKGGKTFSVCDLVMHAAHGMEWHGCAVGRRMRVVYLAGEGINGLRVRLKAWQEHHDSIESAGEFRILPLALSLPDRMLELLTALRPAVPDIVVTDTLNSYFGPGDENSTQDMSAWCASVRMLRDALGCTVVVIHHTGHGDSGRERGSIVLRATADVLIQVAKDETAGELVGFQVIAARDLEPMESAIPLKLVRHETEWLDEDGEPLVSCVVQAADQPVTLPGRGRRPLGEAQSAVLNSAQELARTNTPDAKGEVILIRQEVAQRVKERTNLTRQSISSAWPSLHRRGLLRLIEPGSVALRVRT
jgi:hypothetical protein